MFPRRERPVMRDFVRSRVAPVVSSRFLVASLLLLTLSAPIQAQSDASLTALRLEWLTQLARQDAAGWEADLISSPRGNGLTVGNFQDPSAVLKELRPVLAGNYETVRNRLTALAPKAQARREEVQKDWAEVYRQRIAFRQYAEKQQAAYEFNFESGSQSGFKPHLFDAILLGWAVVAILIVLRMRGKEKRLELRRAQRGVVAAALLLSLAMLPGCGGSSADNRPWIVREEAELTASVKDATEAANAAVAAANKKWQAAVDGWAKLVTAPSESLDTVVQSEEKDIRDRLRKIDEETRLADRLAKDAEEQRAKLTDEKAKLESLVAGAKWRAVAAVVLRVAASAALLVLCFTPFWRSVRANRAAIRQAARQCPRCFRLDKLKVERRGKVDDDEPASLRGKSSVGKGKKETGYVECANCGLRLRLSYLKVPRLCFPAVGVPGSGKTHMLATAYNNVQKGMAPTIATVQQAPSLGDKRFDQYIELIVESRGTAGGTVHALPDPIMIHVRDTDPSGSNTALVNLFDYSGELLNDKIDMSELRKNAVRMDGFMLFLDPTQLYGGDGKVTLKAQLGKLKEFLTDMRDERGVAVGTVIPVPVAVCIPKFDMLLTENPIGGQTVHFTRHMIENMNPEPKETTLGTLAARSELVEQMLPLMFPGVDIRGIVEGFFGKQVMFFPMSSVNLIEGELGVADLSKRSAILPFGVAEPIVWLLHMHGYEVFASDR
jgi:Double-GTPase 2